MPTRTGARMANSVVAAPRRALFPRHAERALPVRCVMTPLSVVERVIELSPDGAPFGNQAFHGGLLPVGLHGGEARGPKRVEEVGLLLPVTRAVVDGAAHGEGHHPSGLLAERLGILVLHTAHHAPGDVEVAADDGFVVVV